MKTEKLIDILEAVLDKVPLEDRLKSNIVFSVLKEMTNRNLEAVYQIATSRLANLSYNIAWANTVRHDNSLKPKKIPMPDKRGLPVSFYDFDNITSKEVSVLNDYFSQWILNLVVRELNEFLSYYLLGAYETCLAAEYREKKIKPADVVDIRKECNCFDRGNINERLKILKDKYSIKTAHTQELASLYVLRNILSHFDGVVQRKDCDPNGEFRVFWPANKYKLKERGREKKRPYHRVSKPFLGDVQGELEITWLSTPRERIYKVGEKIALNHEDLNDLMFFYMYIFNCLHEDLVEFIKTLGFRPRNFSDYIINPEFYATDEHGEKIKLSSG